MYLLNRGGGNRRQQRKQRRDKVNSFHNESYILIETRTKEPPSLNLLSSKSSFPESISKKNSDAKSIDNANRTMNSQKTSTDIISLNTTTTDTHATVPRTDQAEQIGQRISTADRRVKTSVSVTRVERNSATNKDSSAVEMKTNPSDPKVTELVDAKNSEVKSSIASRINRVSNSATDRNNHQEKNRKRERKSIRVVKLPRIKSKLTSSAVAE